MRKIVEAHRHFWNNQWRLYSHRCPMREAESNNETKWHWKWKESEVAQLCPILCDPMDRSLPGSSVRGIFQAIVLEWIAISFSRGSSRPRDGTQDSRIVDRRFTVWATREANDYGHLRSVSFNPFNTLFIYSGYNSSMLPVRKLHPERKYKINQSWDNHCYFGHVVTRWSLIFTVTEKKLKASFKPKSYFLLS